MNDARGLRLTASAALKEKRLTALLQGTDPADPVLEAILLAVQVKGSLELSGLAGTVEEAAALRRASGAVEPRSPLTAGALRAWHTALTGEEDYRRHGLSRADGPAPAPVEFIASRLAILEEWLGADSGRELKPAQQGALALARVMEILPFERGNARVARLAASHLMVRAGSRRPILVSADRTRWDEALVAAFQLHTEPLARLLDEASERALDVLIAVLEGGARG